MKYESVMMLVHMESPYDIYRKMRPQYFSDTVVTYKAELTKEVFKHEMDKLSNDMKQDQFENFATSLAHRFITPNIVPQTGPTGGGDGKTDAETHPVADKIAEKWYIADGGCKSPEKWAFAMSCKEDWKGKVKGDVDKVAKLGRGFTKIYFCSNRQIRSADRKAAEADLKSKYGIEVIILDQDWFVSKVFEDKCIDIAVKELGLSQQYAEIREIGPNDLKRQKRLAEIEEKISNNTSEDCIDTEYVDIVLESAILSRELELSPSIIRGRLVRAENISKQYGTPQQLYKAIYQRGWTEYYWLKNPDKTYQCYLKLKAMIDQEVNVDRIENLLNLYNLLETASALSLFKDDITIKGEENYLKNLYKVLENDQFHQSSFLYLRICLLEMAIIRMSDDEDALNDLLDKLSKALEKATAHIDIPFETHYTIIEMIGQNIVDNEKFEDFVDHLSDILSSRQQDITASNVQMERGFQNLQKKNYVQAIRHLGQCVSLYAKEPTKADYVRACGYLAQAYLGQDLLYAAKVMLMKAVAMLLHKIEITGSSDHLLITVLSELCHLSIRSGQIINFLMAYERREVFLNLSPEYHDQQYVEQRAVNENMLASRFLAGSIDDEPYTKLPAILERLGMVVPVDVLYHKLGYPEKISDEFKQLMQDCPDWDKKMREIIESPEFLYANSISDDKTKLESLINGCRFVVSFDSDYKLQVYSELLLAFMESFISTASFKDFAMAASQIHFDVVKVTEGKSEIVQGSSSSEYVFKVNPDTINDKEAWEAYSKYLALFFTQNAQSRGLGQLFKDKQIKEKFMSRLSVMMMYENDIRALYGDDFKNTINDWISPNDACYPFKGNDDLSTPFEKNKGVQANHVVSSIIDYPLWDKAKWQGCGFLFTRDYSEPPIIMFLFKNMVEGKKIFEGWTKLYKNRNLGLRLAVILGVNKNRPAWYKVHVSQDLRERMKDEEGRYVVQTSRFQQMTPSTTQNMDTFRALYHKYGYCRLSACGISDDNQMQINDPQERFMGEIKVSNIVFREAWQIGTNDEDCCCILQDDDPIIPVAHASDAPVLQLRKS